MLGAFSIYIHCLIFSLFVYDFLLVDDFAEFILNLVILLYIGFRLFVVDLVQLFHENIEFVFFSSTVIGFSMRFVFLTFVQLVSFVAVRVI